MSIDKVRFQDTEAFAAAQRVSLYAGINPVDPKIADRCLRDKVISQGPNSSGTSGQCELAAECTYMNGKVDGVSGFCLKQTVGVEQPNK